MFGALPVFPEFVFCLILSKIKAGIFFVIKVSNIGVDCVTAFIMLSFKYTIALSSSEEDFKETRVSMFSFMTSRNIFQFVLWLYSEVMVFLTGLSWSVIINGEWSDDKSRHDFIAMFS